MNSLSKVIANESLLIPRILREQATMRLANVEPTWPNYIDNEHGWEVKRQIVGRERVKYKAWWELLLKFVVDQKQDSPKVMFAICVLIRERSKRAYAKAPKLQPEKIGVAALDALAIEEYCRSNYESLNPTGGETTAPGPGRIITPRGFKR